MKNTWRSVPGGAQDGVDERPEDADDEPVVGWHADHVAVGQSLGHTHNGAHDPSDDVSQQPVPPLVLGQPEEDGQQAHQVAAPVSAGPFPNLAKVPGHSSAEGQVHSPVAVCPVEHILVQHGTALSTGTAFSAILVLIRQRHIALSSKNGQLREVAPEMANMSRADGSLSKNSFTLRVSTFSSENQL